MHTKHLWKPNYAQPESDDWHFASKYLQICCNAVYMVTAVRQSSESDIARALLAVTVSSDDAAVVEESVSFPTNDGYSIHGTLFGSTATRQAPCAAVFNCGAGIAAKYYRRFARYLAANGIPTLTYDYRGIGQSRVGNLRGFKASVADWSQHDCSAAINCLSKRFPNAALLGVSHSIGALILGGATNAQMLSGLVMICPHTAYFGDYRRGYRLPMAILWHGVMPILTATVGYFPGSALRLGEDIPHGVAMQWAKRLSPSVRGNGDRRTHELMSTFADLRLDALCITISDDAFATPRGAERLKSFFPRMTFNQRMLTPKEAGQPKIGHYGYFRRSAEATLWPLLLAYLRGQVESSVVDYKR
jgi:predicted alpha/beta hydrolase